MDTSFLLNNITLLLQIVGVFVILIVLLRLLYIYKSQQPRIRTLQESSVLLVDDTSIKISAEKVGKSFDGTEYTLSFWIYDRGHTENANWKSDFKKPKGVISHAFSPNIFYDASKGNMLFRVGYLDKDDILQYEEVSLSTNKQHWNHYIIAGNDKQVDFYKNGSLEKSTILKYQPWFANKSMFIGEKGNQSLLTIALVNWGSFWVDSRGARNIYSKEKGTSVVNTNPNTYVEYLNKRFS